MIPKTARRIPHCFPIHASGVAVFNLENTNTSGKQNTFGAQFAFFHMRLMQAVGKWNRKSVHCQSNAKQNTLDKKHQIPTHNLSSFLKIPQVRQRHTWGNVFYKNSMYSFAVTHESRNLKQARPSGQYVDLLRKCARYSLIRFLQYTTFFTICQSFR